MIINFYGDEEIITKEEKHLSKVKKNMIVCLVLTRK